MGRFVCCLGICGILSLPTFANPVEVLHPPIIDGKPMVMPIVKKGGRLWYAASLVSYYRKVPMAYDAATKTLYIMGAKSTVESMVVNDTLFVAMEPRVTTKNMQPGHQYLHRLKPEVEKLERSNSRHAGLTERIYMDSSVHLPNHPWGPEQEQPKGPIIDLDPTGYQGQEVPAHMRHGAHAPHHYPATLPNRLPPRGTPAPPTHTQHPTTVTQPTAHHSQHSTTGTSGHGQHSSGTSSNHGLGGPPTVAAADHKVQGLEPVPQVLGPNGPAVAKMGKNRISSASGKNEVFEVQVAGGELSVSPSGGLLTIKLSQANIARVTQSNLGTFAVRCTDGSLAQAVRSRTYLPGKMLKPGQAREGRLVFRLAPNATPKSVELEGALPLVLPVSVAR